MTVADYATVIGALLSVGVVVGQLRALAVQVQGLETRIARIEALILEGKLHG